MQTGSSKAIIATNLPSDVSILKTKAAAKKGLNVSPERTEVVWPRPEFVSKRQLPSSDESPVHVHTKVSS